MFITKETKIILNKEEFKIIDELFTQLDELDIDYEEFWSDLPYHFIDNYNGYMALSL